MLKLSINNVRSSVLRASGRSSRSLMDGRMVRPRHGRTRQHAIDSRNKPRNALDMVGAVLTTTFLYRKRIEMTDCFLNTE